MVYDKQEKHYITLIDDCLQFFNCGRRKKLLVKYYIVADQNKAKILWNNVTIVENLSIQEAHAFIWGFTRAKEGK